MTRPGFSVELRRAMAERGMSTRQLAALVPCNPRTIIATRKPTWRPVHSMVVAMAEILMWDRLVEISLEVNSRTCAFCGKGFILTRTHGIERKHCSKRCQVNAAHKASRQHGRYASLRDVRERSRKLLDSRLTLYQDAVAAYCRECEPEGLCRTEECPLRAVSPLPLVRVRAA